MRDPRRVEWNENQKKLRSLLTKRGGFQDGIRLFLKQHGMLHTAVITPDLPHHFQDEVLEDFPHEYWRVILPNGEHSVVWLIWHLTRVEDATLSMLVAGEDPLFEQEGWQKKLGISFADPGNAMTQVEIQQLSDEMDIDALLQYREAVARHTREIVQSLTSEAMQQKVSASQIERMKEIGVVREADQWLLDYWGGLTVAGILLMPPTRHTMVHINEVREIKKKMRKLMEKQKK
jgi:hypothetical protein